LSAPERFSPEDQIEAAAAPVATVRAAHGGNVSSVARGGKPVVNRGADPSALDWRVARAVVTCDQQKDPIAARKCLLKATIDRCPSGVEVHPVKVDRAIRVDVAAAQLLVPASIEGLVGDRDP
jgi:hypothetical protein